MPTSSSNRRRKKLLLFLAAVMAPASCRAFMGLCLALAGWGLPSNSAWAQAQALSSPLQASASVAIDNAAASGYIQLVPAVTNTGCPTGGVPCGQRIIILNWNVIASGTTTFQLVYGTGSNCGTGTTELTGPYALTAQNGLATGSIGPQLIVPPTASGSGQALCMNVGSAAQVSGSLAYVQF